MSGADKEYKFGAKNNWRRAVWNSIKAGLVTPVRDATVLYLAGPGDYDREIAVSKGFNPNNLISVERNKKVLSRLRDRGVLTVHGDFIEAAKAWPITKPFDVVFGDFCGDVSKDMLAGIKALTLMQQTARAVFAFNFQRGRDSSMAEARALAATKHRGELLCQWLCDVQQPNTLSYRSGSLVFDSCVFVTGSTADWRRQRAALTRRERITREARAFLSAQAARYGEQSPNAAEARSLLADIVESAAEFGAAATALTAAHVAVSRHRRSETDDRVRRQTAAVSAVHTRLTHV